MPEVANNPTVTFFAFLRFSALKGFIFVPYTVPMETNKPKKSRDALYITIILLLLGGGGLLFVQMSQYKTNFEQYKANFDACAKEKADMEKMFNENGMAEMLGSDLKEGLANLMEDYQSIETSNAGMRDSIQRQIRKIDSLQREAEKNKGNAYMIYKLKKETETLRSIMQGYVRTIDSLNTMNKELRADLSSTKQTLNTVEKERDEVKEKNKDLEVKVAKGSVLQTANFTAGAIHLRNSGKQVETTRAGRADMIKACCTILENTIAKPGTKNVYMVVTMPDASILTQHPEQTFKWEGGESQYSLLREVDYQNQSLDICFYADVKVDLPKGVYIVELFCEKAKIGKATFTLK
jgi:hypothetical protein